MQCIYCRIYCRMVFVASTIRSCGFATGDVSTQSLASVSLLAYIALCRPRLLQHMTSGYCILSALKSVLAIARQTIAEGERIKLV
jgi:hypothetical protein